MKLLWAVLIAISTAWLAQDGRASDSSFRMVALFTDQAGVVQYVQLQESSGLNGQQGFAGLTLESISRIGVVKRYTFPHDLPSAATAFRSVLIGTEHNGPPDTDFALPPGFIPADGGVLIFAGSDSWDYGIPPANGLAMLLRQGNTPSGSPCVPPYIFAPFTGFPTGLSAPMDPVVEYYNKTLDHYFMTASQPDVDALDSGRIPGWERTGQSFTAWITRVKCLFESPPGMGPVCRIYLPPASGNSHFFSASPDECSDTVASHPEYIQETPSAFWATLPDPSTGACGYDQVAIYRLWNARADSNHRYTTDPAIRDAMLARGYVAEGYGPGNVAMCVGGSIPGT
jgi:hypothetical protein